MNLFSSLFGSSEDNENQSSPIVDWIPLIDLGQLDEIITTSHEKPALIFKHSTRCGISRMGLKQFESSFDLDGEVTCYFLDLLAHRWISNEVASRFKIPHESPQLLLIKDGNCVYHASHGAINVADLRNRME